MHDRAGAVEDCRPRRTGIDGRLDEASGVPQALWDAATTLASNEASRLLAIGNPDDVGSYFAGVCSPGSGWAVIGGC